MIDFRNYEAMTFDCYGTLIDWETGILSVLSELRRRHNLDATDHELLESYARAETHVQCGYYRRYREVLREVMKQVAQHYKLDVDGYDVDALVVSLPLWKPFPDTIDALHRLGGYFGLGVISNIDDDLFESTSRHLETPFDWVVTAEQAGAYKPAHRTFRHAWELMGVHPSRIVHVAQSRFHDIAPVMTMDGTTVWVDRRRDGTSHGATSPGDAEPNLTVPDLATLLSIVESQLGEPTREVEEKPFHI
ncbi:MAG: HAD-IA family hydrolase [Candidatus Krumholzibacteriota bacterium]|nr:HAD-IA family hydrolase [Candidatus Krumholzibacteriota bacterium]